MVADPRNFLLAIGWLWRTRMPAPAPTPTLTPTPPPPGPNFTGTVTIQTPGTYKIYGDAMMSTLMLLVGGGLSVLVIAIVLFMAVIASVIENAR